MTSPFSRSRTPMPSVLDPVRIGLILGLTGLQSCSLTAMLWAEDESTLPVGQGDAECRVHQVRGNFLSPPAIPEDPAEQTGRRLGIDDAVEVQFSVVRTRNTPAEVDRFTPENPGRLTLRPPDEEENWFSLPGAQMFEPKMWEFGVFRGNYFTTARSTVPLLFVGAFRPSAVGSITDQTDAPASWRQMTSLASRGHQPSDSHGLLQKGLQALQRRNWIHLIRGENVYTERDAMPLAWLDPKGRVVPPEQMSALVREDRIGSPDAVDLTDYTLLGRLDGTWGDPLYVRVPLPILVQGKNLQLKRMGENVLWKRTQVWRGTLANAAATSAASTDDPTRADGEQRTDTEPASQPSGTDNVLAHQVQTRSATSIPLMANKFVYTYAEEDDSSSVLLTLGKILLTPPAVLIDFVAQTSVFYVDVVRWLSSGNDQEWAGPIGRDDRR